MRLIIFLIISFNVATAQQLSRKFFVSTQWFTNNHDSAYYKADTILLFKYQSDDGEKSDVNKSKSLGHGDYVNVAFLKKNVLHLSTTIDAYMAMVDNIKRSWAFNSKHNNLIFSSGNDTLAIFKPVAVRQIKLPAKQSGATPISTTELKLLRIRKKT